MCPCADYPFYHVELNSVNIENYDQIAFFGWSDNIGVQNDVQR